MMIALTNHKNASGNLTYHLTYLSYLVIGTVKAENGSIPVFIEIVAARSANKSA